MPGDDPIFMLAVLFVAILILPLLAHRVGLPEVVALIVAGVVIGPHGLHVLTITPSIEMLAMAGLVYLVFQAGVEIDMQQFERVRSQAAVFGVVSFWVPAVAALIIGWYFGQPLAASFLLAAIIGSHTLVAYPVASKMGIIKSRPVAVTVGATVLTDMQALLILAFVVSAVEGDASVVSFLTIILMLAALALILFYAVPEVGRRFFRMVGPREGEFHLVMALLFTAAFAAQEIGTHAIVGAFLFGLAANRLVPDDSRLMGKIAFLGRGVLIPIFLVYVGLLSDIGAFFASPEALALGVFLTVGMLLAKLAAAWGVGHHFGWSPSERLTSWSLSHAQAAATLATALVGVHVGIFGETVFNAVITMIIVSCTSAPLLTQFFGQHIEVEYRDLLSDKHPPDVLVPVANPDTEGPLLDLAGLLAAARGGRLLPLHVAREANGEVEDLGLQRELLARATQMSREAEVDVQPVPRIDESVAKGIRRGAIEYDVGLLVLGWKGYSQVRDNLFSGVLDELMQNPPVPMVISRIGRSLQAARRLVVVTTDAEARNTELVETLDLASHLARSLAIPWVVYHQGAAGLVGQVQTAVEQVKKNGDDRAPVGHVANSGVLVRQLEADDVVLVPFGKEDVESLRRAQAYEVIWRLSMATKNILLIAYR